MWFLIPALAALFCGLIPFWKSRAAAIRELEALRVRLACAENDNTALTGQLDGLRSRFAHDLRSPLQLVLGYAELLAAETAGPLNSMQKQFVENLRAGASRITLLIENRDVQSGDEVAHGNSR